VSAGASHALALDGQGRVWGWGGNNCGQTGDPNVTGWCGNFQVETPRQIWGLSGAAAVAAGRGHSVALASDGTVLTWGGNGNGELGRGTMDIETLDTHPAPTAIWGFGGVDAISATAHTIVRKSDGSLWAWGHDQWGQIGNGTAYPQWPYGVAAPAQVSAF